MKEMLWINQGQVCIHMKRNEKEDLRSLVRRQGMTQQLLQVQAVTSITSVKRNKKKRTHIKQVQVNVLLLSMKKNLLTSQAQVCTLMKKRKREDIHFREKEPEMIQHYHQVLECIIRRTINYRAAIQSLIKLELVRDQLLLTREKLWISLDQVCIPMKKRKEVDLHSDKRKLEMILLYLQGQECTSMRNSEKVGSHFQANR